MIFPYCVIFFNLSVAYASVFAEYLLPLSRSFSSLQVAQFLASHKDFKKQAVGRSQKYPGRLSQTVPVRGTAHGTRVIFWGFCVRSQYNACPVFYALGFRKKKPSVFADVAPFDIVQNDRLRWLEGKSPATFLDRVE